jgi:cobalt-zinc-cadmium efflux system outer membrane protein
LSVRNLALSFCEGNSALNAFNFNFVKKIAIGFLLLKNVPSQPTGNRLAAMGLVLTLLMTPPRLGQPAPAGDSTKTYTLPQLEAAMLEKNLSLLSGKYDVLQSQSDIVTAGLRPNPSLNLNADIFPLPPRTTDQRQYGASLQVPFELGGKRDARIISAKNLSKGAKLQLASSIRQLLQTLRLAYYDVQAAQEGLKNAEADLASYHKLSQLNENRFKAGQISASEFSRVVLAESQAELQRDEAKLTLLKANQALTLALGKQEDIALKDTLTIDAKLVEPIEQLQAVAFARRAELLAAKAAKDAAVANLNLQEANAVIDVDLSLDYSNQPGAVQIFGFSAQVPLPIFSRNQGELEKAKYKITQADLQISAAELTVATDVRSAYAEYRTRKNAIEKFHQPMGGQPMGGASPVMGILARAAAIKQSAEAAYQKGGVSLLEVLDAVQTYRDIYKSYIDAIVGYNKSLANLNAATGIDYQFTDDN